MLQHNLIFKVILALQIIYIKDKLIKILQRFLFYIDRNIV